MPLHLEALQYILQLVGQRQRQRMSLHLGGTAIHLAIGRAQMQAVKKINNSTQEKFTIQDFRSSWQTVEQALQKNL